MSRKVIVVLTITLLLLFVLAMATSAQTNARTVTADTYYDIFLDPGTVSGSGPNIFAEGSETACNLTRAGLLKWDLSDVSDSATVGNVTITLHTLNSITGTSDQTVVALFEAPDNWDETTPQGNLPVPPDHNTTTPLATTTGPFTLGGNVVFQVSGTNDPLVQYVQSQITGDNVASFWVEITDGCPGGGTGRIVWNSRESGTSTMELSTPNAVSLSNFSANDSNTVNWGLIAGLFALAAVVIVGVGYGVRRHNS